MSLEFSEAATFPEAQSFREGCTKSICFVYETLRAERAVPYNPILVSAIR